MSISQAERLARLETEMKQVIATQQKFSDDIKGIDGKLDTLITLRDKGVGVFWLASALMGTGILGTVYALIEWIRG